MKCKYERYKDITKGTNVMTQEQHNMLLTFARKNLEKCYSESETDKANKYYRFISFLCSDEITKKINENNPLDFENAVSLADNFRDMQDICDVIDRLMNFKEGESYRQETYAVVCSGNVKKLTDTELILSPYRIAYPTRTFRDIAESCIGDELIIKGSGTKYLTTTFNGIASTGNLVLVETLFSFREYEDGHTDYLSRISYNLTKQIDDDGKFIPRLDRLGCACTFRSSKVETISLV